MLEKQKHETKTGFFLEFHMERKIANETSQK